MSKRYPSDLADKQWRLIEPLVPQARFGGRPYANERRELVYGLLYRVKDGCSWPGSAEGGFWNRLFAGTTQDIEASEEIWQFLQRHSL